MLSNEKNYHYILLLTWVVDLERVQLITYIIHGLVLPEDNFMRGYKTRYSHAEL